MGPAEEALGGRPRGDRAKVLARVLTGANVQPGSQERALTGSGRARRDRRILAGAFFGRCFSILTKTRTCGGAEGGYPPPMGGTICSGIRKQQKKPYLWGYYASHTPHIRIFKVVSIYSERYEFLKVRALPVYVGGVVVGHPQSK